MKKIILLSLVLVLINCGIKQEEYNRVVSKNKLLEEKLAKLNDKFIILKNKLELSTIKSNLSRLKEMLNEFLSGKTDKTRNIIKLIHAINPKQKTNKFFEVYADKSGLIVNILLHILKLDKSYNDAIAQYLNKFETLKKYIQNNKNRIAELDNNGYQYVTFVIVRRFDTDSYTGKGLYESYKISGMPKKVVLIARANEINLSPYGGRRKLVVRSLGEKKTTVRESNAFRSTTIYKYYEYYETVDNSKNPILVKEKLLKIEKDYIKLQEEFSVKKLILLKDYNDKIKIKIKGIIDVL